MSNTGALQDRVILVAGAAGGLGAEAAVACAEAGASVLLLGRKVRALSRPATKISRPAVAATISPSTSGPGWRAPHSRNSSARNGAYSAVLPCTRTMRLRMWSGSSVQDRSRVSVAS